MTETPEQCQGMHVPNSRPSCFVPVMEVWFGEARPEVCQAFVSPEHRRATQGGACDGCARTPMGWIRRENQRGIET